VVAVATERLKSPRARLFVALELPDPVRGALSAWQREAVAAEPLLRAPATETLHVTLCFLGYVPERRIDEVAAVVDGLEPRSVELHFELEPVGVPPARPRLYAASAPSPEADALAAELSDRLRTARLHKPEKRPFWSHVTVARVRPERASPGSGGRRRRNRPARVEIPPPALPKALGEPFCAVRITLYRSILRPQGAEYVPLASLDLPPRPQSGAKKE
jgi:RNA 2',3'-cyclic 3'-phosphodiesterase